MERENRELRQANEILRKASAYFALADTRPPVQAMIAFVDAHRDVYGVEPITRVLPIASSTYHEFARWRREPDKVPARQRRDAELSREVMRIHAENFGVYGGRKVWRQMLREGFKVARCTVARLMRQLGLKGVIRGKKVKTTIPDKAAACPGGFRA